MKSKILALVVAVAMLTVGATGAVAAHNGGNDVGASGHCSADGDGGGASVGASSDGSVDDTNPSEIESVVRGVAFFAQQKQANPDRTDTCDGGSGSYDYIEGHAGNGDTQVQYCYSEDNADSGGSAGTGDQCEA